MPVYGLPPPPLPDAASAGDTPASVDGGDVRMAPEIPESAAPASVPAALPLANLQPPMDDVKRNAPTSLLAAAALSLLAAAALSLPSPLASLPPPEKPTYCRLRQHEPRLATISSAQVLQARACSRIAKGRRLRSSPLRSEPAVPTSPASNPAASTPVLLEAEAINSQDICMGMCSRIAKGRLRSSPLRSEPAVPTSPASYPVASTPVLLEAEAFNSQDFCFTPFDLGMWAIFCDSLIGNRHTRDRHSNDTLLCLHADFATALMDSRHLALARLAKLA